MSNVKVNGNTYNDVTSVKLALADGTGYATYSEGQSQDENTMFDALMTGDNLGDYTNDELTQFNPVPLSYLTFGTWSLPNAAKISGGNIYNFNCENLLLPGVVGLLNNGYPQFRGVKITGVLDMRSYTTGGTNAASLSFFLYGATVGTVRLDSMNLAAGNMFGSSTITNIVWGGASLTADGIKTALNAATAITNLYITDVIYDDVAALIADGTITKVTNLHKYSEWSDD